MTERLADRGRSIDDVVQVEHQQQVAGQLIIRNLITSMRLMSLVDWAELIEGVSLVEAALRQGTNVAAMDFATRDAYRHGVEELALGAGRSELDVAQEAVRRATQAEPGSAENDPGFYLVGRGRIRFEREIGARLTVRERLKRALLSARTGVYLIGIIAVSLLFLAAFVAAARGTLGTFPDAALLVGALVLLAVIPASEPAVAIINRIVAAVMHPRRLPRLELKEGWRNRCGRWSRCRSSLPLKPRSRSNWSTWRRIISPTTMVSSISPSSPTGATPIRRKRPRTRRCWRRHAAASPNSTGGTGRHPTAVRGSSSFTGGGSGTRPSADGSAGSASAASFTN